MMLASGLTAAAAALLLAGSPRLAAAFVSWAMAGAVLLVTGVRRLRRVEAVRIYEEVVDSVVKEFGLHDVKPLYAPSSIAGEPVMILSPANPGAVRRVPRRMLIFAGDTVYLRVPTLGTMLLGELGGVSDIPSAEAVLKTMLKDYLEVADDVLVAEEAGGESYVVEISRPRLRYDLRSNVPSNVYCQVVGPVLAEAVGALLKLEEASRSGSSLKLRLRRVV